MSEQTEAADRVALGGLCGALARLFFPHKGAVVEDALGRVDEILVALHEKARAEHATARQLRASIVKLRDRSLRVDGTVASRESAEKTYKVRLATALKTARTFERQIAFFESTRANIVQSQMAEEMAANIASLRENMAGVRAIDPERLRDDMEEIEDVNSDVRAITELVADNMHVNSWDADMGAAEEELEAFLAEADDGGGAEVESDDEEDAGAAMAKPKPGAARRRLADHDYYRVSTDDKSERSEPSPLVASDSEREDLLVTDSEESEVERDDPRKTAVAVAVAAPEPVRAGSPAHHPATSLSRRSFSASSSGSSASSGSSPSAPTVAAEPQSPRSTASSSAHRSSFSSVASEDPARRRRAREVASKPSSKKPSRSSKQRKQRRPNARSENEDEDEDEDDEETVAVQGAHAQAAEDEETLREAREARKARRALRESRKPRESERDLRGHSSTGPAERKECGGDARGHGRAPGRSKEAARRRPRAAMGLDHLLPQVPSARPSPRGRGDAAQALY